MTPLELCAALMERSSADLRRLRQAAVAEARQHRQQALLAQRVAALADEILDARHPHDVVRGGAS